MMARKAKGLGERHKKILKFLESHQSREGFPPTIREIGEATDISSTSVVNYYLDQLEKMGKIERQRKISRGISLTESSPLVDMFKIPVAGRIVAGEPIPVPASDFTYFDAESSVDVARSLLPSRSDTDELFALEVDGDSMIDAMINDGDIVVMKSTGGEAKNGEMVAVWLPERDETTLKYFYKESEGYRLQPANPTMEPIHIGKDEPLEIKGKVVMVIRQIDKTVI
ncbi:MAG: repressor LexA [Anaerolineae bacterium]|nr:repressor LexA [Anaerolineae bacterium]MBT7190565.1 repressor LexA [Anaerolineae bacterium]